MEYVKCGKCEVVFNSQLGHECKRPSSYNQDDQFQASDVSPSEKEAFRYNSELCIW